MEGQGDKDDSGLYGEGASGLSSFSPAAQPLGRGWARGDSVVSLGRHRALCLQGQEHRCVGPTCCVPETPE